MTAPASLSSVIADFVAQVRFEDLTPQAITAGKRTILDWFASTCGGAPAESTQVVSSIMRAEGGVGQATSIPDRARVPASHAAMINAAACHVLQMDDVHRRSLMHGGTSMVSALFAVAETEGLSGRDLLLATAVAYEVGFRLGEAANPAHGRYWNTTATCGAIGAAAGVGKLLGLTPSQMVSALGFAGTMAAGLWEGLADGDLSSRVQPGNAARNAILAARLAQGSLKGAPKILEGRRGFFAAMAPGQAPAAVVQDLFPAAPVSKVTENGFKFHAACGYTHTAIDAVLAAARELNLRGREALGDVTRVQVRLFSRAVDFLAGIEPTNPTFARYSLPFCLASALADGEVTIASFTEERLADADLRALMAKVSYAADPALDREYPDKWTSVVSIELADGRKAEARVDFPKGDPRNPLSDEELAAKFYRLAAGYAPREELERVYDLIHRLEEVDNVGTAFAFLSQR